MRVLLTDASGLTSRQTATRLAAAGHVVGAMTPSRIVLGACTRHIRRLHRAPAYGADPYGWLEAALAAFAAGGYELLLPTQEQVALLACEASRLKRLGVPVAVPPFGAVQQVQDKLAQVRTLSALGLRHPESWVVGTPGELRSLSGPLYVKAAIGTASAGVWPARTRAELEAAAEAVPWSDGAVLAQRATTGPLVMIQAVYAAGRLVAHHACVREREGISGGAAVKRSVTPAGLEDDLARLGEALDWHGALSLDAILTPEGLSYIDVNPRLVEPQNAWHAGVDLVGAMLAVTLGRRPPPSAPSVAGVRTHQLLIGVLGAASEGGRPAVARELAAAARHRGPYAGSAEELTPLRGDARTIVPVALAALAGLVAPAAAPRLAGGAAASYALTPAAWAQIRAHAAAAA